jgi:hypothetical protein
MNKSLAILLSIAAFLMLAPGSASASTGQICTVKMIGYSDQDPSGTTNLYMSCVEDSTTHVYLAFSNPATPTCGPRLTFDGVKIFQTMATAAWLSGKPLTVWWTACTGGVNRGIVSMNFGS